MAEDEATGDGREATGDGRSFAIGGREVTIGGREVTIDGRTVAIDGREINVGRREVLGLAATGALFAGLSADGLPGVGGGHDGADVPYVGLDTRPAVSVTGSSATLVGAVTTIQGAGSARCWFEYRQVGEEPAVDTDRRVISAPTTTRAQVTGLRGDTRYDVWLLAEVDDRRYAGKVVTFSTDSDG